MTAKLICPRARDKESTHVVIFLSDHLPKHTPRNLASGHQIYRNKTIIFSMFLRKRCFTSSWWDHLCCRHKEGTTITKNFKQLIQNENGRRARWYPTVPVFVTANKTSGIFSVGVCALAGGRVASFRCRTISFSNLNRFWFLFVKKKWLLPYVLIWMPSVRLSLRPCVWKISIPRWWKGITNLKWRSEAVRSCF